MKQGKHSRGRRHASRSRSSSPSRSPSPFRSSQRNAPYAYFKLPPSSNDFSVREGIDVCLLALKGLHKVGKKEKRKVGGWEGGKEGVSWDDVYEESFSELEDLARIVRTERDGR